MVNGTLYGVHPVKAKVIYKKGLRVEETPDGKIVGYIPAGTVITIDDIEHKGLRIWGHTSNGWVSLAKKSGSLFYTNIQFNSNPKFRSGTLDQWMKNFNTEGKVQDADSRSDKPTPPPKPDTSTTPPPAPERKEGKVRNVTRYSLNEIGDGETHKWGWLYGIVLILLLLVVAYMLGQRNKGK